MKRLLTFDDLCNYYTKYKKSMHFSDSDTPIVVQTKGILKFEKTDEATGLTAVSLQACHTEKNLNKSSISSDTMTKMITTFKNRPILGFIHEVNGKEHFGDHRMHIDEEKDKIIYDEVPVGIIPETNNAHMEYNEKEKHFDVFVDGWLFNEYSSAPEILEREEQCWVSVELSLTDMSYDAHEKTLIINDGYFSGVTILGKNEDGSEVKPGMAGSNIKLKDFKQNNSIFSSITEEENNKLVDTLNVLNETLKGFNIDNNLRKEDEIKVVENEEKVEQEFTEEETQETVVENEVEESETMDEVVETEEETPVEETPEVDENEACGTKKKKCAEEDDAEEEGEEPETEEPEADEEEACGGKKKKYSFELSHGDIRNGIYELLAPYMEADNDWYWVSEVYDGHFVYEGCCNAKIYKQSYVKTDDIISFEGERTELFRELLTASEKAELETMRSNYASIQTKLNAYEEAEELAEKATVFSDEAYKAYLDTNEFKTLMSEETMKKFTKEELVEKADAALGKVVKATKTFAMNVEKEDKPVPAMFAFAAKESRTSFLDGLLIQKK